MVVDGYGVLSMVFEYYRWLSMVIDGATSGVAPHLDEGSEDPTTLNGMQQRHRREKQAAKVNERGMVLRQRQWAHSDGATTLQVGILL